MRFLSEEEINEDLRFNFPSQGLILEDLVNPDNKRFAESKEKAIEGYTCGYLIRKFIEKMKLRLSLNARGILPISFNVTGFKEIYEIIGKSCARPFEELKDLGVINFEHILKKKVVFYVRNFDEMKEVMRERAEERDIPARKFYIMFERELGSIRPYVNRISERTFKVYREVKDRMEGPYLKPFQKPKLYAVNL
ncbi:MAG: hypothetical protein DRP00_02000 [Candidatus Aenigmatarchaeota archaeon]|nr:MAG: hypothetical protein DRP00_02000 [Candidatus Aenigmarchaeota archaeon]